MRHVFRFITMFLPVTAIVACDYWNGVTRAASVGEVLLPIACIENATASVPGVENVQVKDEPGGRELTWRGLQQPEEIHRVTYDYKGLYGSFYFLTNYQGKSQFRHTYGYINATPPKEEVDTMRVAMTAIENAMAHDCSLQLVATSSRRELRRRRVRLVAN